MFEFAADLASGSSPTLVMINPVLAPAQWAQMEFALVRLGDPRRTQRLVKLATRLAESPGGTLPQALPRWEELKAAYRFFSRPENTHEQILRPPWERTLAACLEPGDDSPSPSPSSCPPMSARRYRKLWRCNLCTACAIRIQGSRRR